MVLTITAKKFKLTQPIKEYIQVKLCKIDNYIKNPEVRVVLETRKNENKIEVTILDKDSLIKSESIHEDMYSAVDMVMDKLKNQLERYIEKRNEYKKESIRKKGIENMAAKVKNQEGVIVKRKVFDLKPMHEQEAILQMNLLNHPTFMFFDAEIEKICLLYKRKDGNYGIIETV